MEAPGSQEGANKLLFEFYQQSKDKKKGTEKDGANSVTENELIIKLAAELIRNDIKALDCNKNEYFSFDELTSEQMLSYVPASLQLSLGQRFMTELDRSSSSTLYISWDSHLQKHLLMNTHLVFRG